MPGVLDGRAALRHSFLLLAPCKAPARAGPPLVCRCTALLLPSPLPLLSSTPLPTHWKAVYAPHTLPTHWTAVYSEAVSRGDEPPHHKAGRGNGPQPGGGFSGRRLRCTAPPPRDASTTLPNY